MKKTLAAFICFTGLVIAEPKMDLLISQPEILKRVSHMAMHIDQDYQGEKLTLIVVMKGGICIASDLMKALKTPCTLEYIRASSYGSRGTNRGEVVITGLEKLDLQDQHLLVIDDILDSGHTLSGVIARLQEMHPKSIKSFVLLKKNIARDVDLEPDYTLFEIENRFVIGYGLDYKEYFRNLPGIYAFEDDVPFEP